jgi:hypothetical protein
MSNPNPSDNKFGHYEIVPHPPLQPLPMVGTIWISPCGKWVYLACSKTSMSQLGHVTTNWWQMVQSPFTK